MVMMMIVVIANGDVIVNSTSIIMFTFISKDGLQTMNYYITLLQCSTHRKLTSFPMVYCTYLETKIFSFNYSCFTRRIATRSLGDRKPQAQGLNSLYNSIHLYIEIQYMYLVLLYQHIYC